MTASIRNIEIQFQLNHDNGDAIEKDLFNQIFAKYSDFNAKSITKMMINGIFS